MRTIDKTKKSNIKCEHCEYWNKDSDDFIQNKKTLEIMWPCTESGKYKAYYQRCSAFKWHHRYNQPKGE